MIKAIIFDLWNTLVSPNGEKFTQRIARALELDEDYVLDYIRSSSSRHNEIHYKEIVREIWKYRFQDSIPPKYLKRVEKEYKSFVNNTVYISNAIECLKTLRSNGIKIYILSNSTSVSIDVVERLSIHTLVDEVFLSCQIGFLKPDPRSFYTIVNELNILPNNLCVVGDKITTDILGAKISGMKVIWFAPHIKINNQHLIPVDLLGIATDLDQVPNIIGINE